MDRHARNRHAQQGLTLTSFLVVLAVVGFALYIGMKLFPMYQEFWAVKKALKGVATAGGPADAGSIRRSLEKYFDVGYIDDVKPENITVEHAPAGGSLITVDYEVRKPLIYNLDIVGKFHTSETMQSGAE